MAEELTIRREDLHELARRAGAKVGAAGNHSLKGRVEDLATKLANATAERGGMTIRVVE